MATIRFWGGVGVIGSSKVMIEQDGFRLLLDFGVEFAPEPALLRHPVAVRPGRELADRILVGTVPPIERFYRPDQTGATGIAGGGDGRTAVLISHAHLDHIGLCGWIDPEIPIYAAPETIRVMQAWERSGLPWEGAFPRLLPLEADVPLFVGPFTVTRVRVDHDIVGASGFVVQTEDGEVAYTGDIRFHGRHPEWSRAFVRRAKGARALVTEGTTLSFPSRRTLRTEADVDRAFGEVLTKVGGLVVLSIYPTNLERVEAFCRIARRAGREILWRPQVARFLTALGLDGAAAWGEDGVGFSALQRHPGRYIVQMDPADYAHLLDLPPGPDAVFVHANGEPLGEFDPRWPLLQDWLKFRRMGFWSVGTGGHAEPEALQQMVDAVAAKNLFAIHTLAPERLLPGLGARRHWVQLGRAFALNLEESVDGFDVV